MGDGEAIRRRYRAGKQDLAGRVCVSFLIADDDGRQISEAAAVKNCRRDWKTHFGREREERKRVVKQNDGVFSCDEVRVRSSMDDKQSYNDLEIVTFRGLKSMSA